MDRLFLDANVLFSAAYREVNGLLDLWRLPDIQLISSTFAVSEAQRNLKNELQLERLTTLIQTVRIFGNDPSVTLPLSVLLPEKDVPILTAAIEAQATHLLTGDKRHFGVLFGQQIEGVLIETPSTYLARRRGTTPR